MKHHPKGSMCITCKHATRDCSGLDFSKMKPLEANGQGVTVVRCDKFKRNKEEAQA